MWSQGLLDVDDERAFGAPPEGEPVAGRDPVHARTVVLDIDGHRTCRRVDDVLRRDPDVGALGDDAAERVTALTDAQLLRTNADLHLAASAAERVARHV